VREPHLRGIGPQRLLLQDLELLHAQQIEPLDGLADQGVHGQIAAHVLILVIRVRLHGQVTGALVVIY